MGCFSYMCKECGKPILSNSLRGQKVELFLLEDSKVIEKMIGEYDSYGRVFDKNFDSIKWKMDWGDIVGMGFDGKPENGIAAIHTKCFTGETPTTQSDSDPNQGWGEDYELMSNCEMDMDFNL